MDRISLQDLNFHEFDDMWVKSKFSGVMVKTNITTQERLECAKNVADLLGVDNTNVFNIIKFEACVAVEMCMMFTNLAFSDEDLEDYGKLYDKLRDNGFVDEFYYLLLNGQDKGHTYHLVEDVVMALYDYKNTAYGIMEGITSKYKNEEMDLERITESIKDPEALPLLKDIITKLG